MPILIKHQVKAKQLPAVWQSEECQLVTDGVKSLACSRGERQPLRCPSINGQSRSLRLLGLVLAAVVQGKIFLARHALLLLISRQVSAQRSRNLFRQPGMPFCYWSQSKSAQNTSERPSASQACLPLLTFMSSHIW